MEKVQEKQMKNIEEINNASLKKILTTKKESEKLLFYLSLFIFFTILSLSKNEGGIMVLVIFLSSFFIDFIY